MTGTRTIRSDDAIPAICRLPASTDFLRLMPLHAGKDLFQHPLDAFYGFLQPLRRSLVGGAIALVADGLQRVADVMIHFRDQLEAAQRFLLLLALLAELPLDKQHHEHAGNYAARYAHAIHSQP